MVKIRLTKLGRHKKPFFRVVALDSRTKCNGAYLANLGTYDPITGETKFHEEEVIKFLLDGAQPTNTTLNLLKAKGIWKKYLDAKAFKSAEASKKTSKTTTKKVTKTVKKPAEKSAETTKKVSKPVAKQTTKKPADAE